jgi:hypothetical protein
MTLFLLILFLSLFLHFLIFLGLKDATGLSYILPDADLESSISPGMDNTFYWEMILRPGSCF